MRPLLSLALAAAVAWWAPAVRARQASPANASYTLAATLDPTTRVITGRGRLWWRNTSPTPAVELRFHLYWNAWRDDGSTWMREWRLVGSVPPLRDEERATIDVTRLSLATSSGAVDLLPGARFVAPDDGNEDDRTVLSVPLGTAVAPGATVDVDMAWTSRVPRTVARTGVLGSYYFVAHWFPKIGVLEDGGWNAHQFHVSTEFFADYGTYDVSLTVPAGWIVGATGRERSRVANDDGTETHRYTETDVHDFAWTASPDFVDVRRRIDVPGSAQVDVRLLLQPEHREQEERHFEAAKRGLEKFTGWFGGYPYGHLTIVDPVTIVNPIAQGGSTDGMEYPTLITAGTRWYAPSRGVDLEEVVIHELGHQFWQGIVGSNEFEHAWMDEGITTYATARALEEAYPGRFARVSHYFGGLVPWTYTEVPWSRDVDGNRLFAYRAEPGLDAPSTASWRFFPSSAASVSYAKTALWLTALERMFGWDVVRQALASAYAGGRFRHPTPNELFAHVSSAANRDLSWFVDAVYRSSATFDYAVESVIRHPRAGAVDNVVVLRRNGEGVFPVDVLTTFDDGRSVVARWDGRDRWHRLEYRREARIRSVQVDPQRILTLDLNYTNNSWTADPEGPRAAREWALRWTIWFQTLLLTYAFFA
jgi:hypothetical protein